MGSLSVEIESIHNDFDKLREDMHKTLNGDLDERSIQSLKSEVNYLTSLTDEKVDEFENINTALLKNIEKLNKENSEKQKMYNKLKRKLQSNENLESGVRVALKDGDQKYISILKNITLKNVALILMFLYLSR